MSTIGVETTLSGKNLFKNNLIPQRNKFILDEVKLAAKRMGQYKIDPEVFAITAKDVISEVERSYSYYSLEELEEVFRLGAMGKLGDNVSISMRTVLSWLEKYAQEYRAMLMRQIKPSELMIEERAGDSRDMTEEEVYSYLDVVVDYYKEGQPMYSFSYDIFANAGLTDLFNEKKEHYMKLGKASIRQMQDNAISSAIYKAIDTGEDNAVKLGKVEALKDFLNQVITQKTQKA